MRRRVAGEGDGPLWGVVRGRPSLTCWLSYWGGQRYSGDLLFYTWLDLYSGEDLLLYTWLDLI